MNGSSALDPMKKVTQFAGIALAAGADGIICSPRELPWLEKIISPRPFARVTPGVRPQWAAGDDQKRTLTPSEAIRAGATQLVIGRPILRPPSSIKTPVEAAKRILDEISEALK